MGCSFYNGYLESIVEAYLSGYEVVDIASHVSAWASSVAHDMGYQKLFNQKIWSLIFPLAELFICLETACFSQFPI